MKAQQTNHIWNCYLNDFIAQILHVEVSKGISQDILRAFFTQLHDKAVFERVAQLHIYINIYQHDLPRMATVLRQLDHIQHVSCSGPNTTSYLMKSSAKDLVDEVQQSLHPLGTPQYLTAFVVGHLFNGLMGAAFGETSPSPANLVNNTEGMLTWYKAYRYIVCVLVLYDYIVTSVWYSLFYLCICLSTIWVQIPFLLLCRDIMCLPSIKQQVYSTLSPNCQPAITVMEARLNVMQIIFLFLRSFSCPTEVEPSVVLLRDSLRMFETLFHRYFDDNMEVCMITGESLIGLFLPLHGYTTPTRLFSVHIISLNHRLGMLVCACLQFSACSFSEETTVSYQG